MPEPPIDIIEAKPRDLDRLYVLLSESLPFDAFSAQLLEEKLFFNPRPGDYVFQTLRARAGAETIGALQHVVQPGARLAWLGLFAVDQAHRRRGIARRLYHVACDSWRNHAVQTVDAIGIPCNYLVAGIDPRYAAAIGFVESLGFARRGEPCNLRAQLDRDFNTAEAEAKLLSRGIEVRRARPGDAQLLERFFAAQFGESWLIETQLAMGIDPPAVHVAVQGGEIVGFAAHSTMNREWGNFGPMGTSERLRGQGVGQVLLHRCMADLKQVGFTSAVIPWTGVYPFYRKFLNCEIERTFRQYRLELEP